MDSFSFTSFTKIVVRTDGAFVASADEWEHVASVAGHGVMDVVSSFRGFRLVEFLSYSLSDLFLPILDLCSRELVDQSRHLLLLFLLSLHLLLFLLLADRSLIRK